MKIEHCAKCKAKIVWLKTAKGKSMPVDASSVQPNESDVFMPGLGHVSHFATCTHPELFRKKKHDSK